MSSLGDKRRKALQGHRNVTRKISRQKSANGVEVSGSSFDPRESPEFIRNADAKALNALIRRQDKFLDRGTQFVPDAHSKPLTVQSWNAYKQAESTYNSFVNSFYEDYKDIRIDPAGQTVDSRMQAVTPLHAHMGQRTTDSPYKQRNKSSRSVYGETGLKQLIKDLRNRSHLSHEAKTLKNHRDGIMKMLDTVGDLEMQESVAKLTKKQWALLWKYTNFASNIKPAYNHYKDSMAGNRSVLNSQMIETDLAVAKQYVKWAANVKNIGGRL